MVFKKNELNVALLSISQKGHRTPSKKISQQINDAIIMDSEAAVLANFEFLGSNEISDDDDISDEFDLGSGDDADSDLKTTKRNKNKDMVPDDGKCL